ncbi:MAG: 2-dehydro-3-deoxy-6-phosphogalactonate aldolase [Betaproteobacteria bacterium]|jgi:2-dehydro-3-deoxyphosphogalactonate aldolase|nr:2-dehydro-3-deoxy-6-phosphogalactonate aldolase [Rhodocyclaceae bacterium]MCA3135255.1 2-dehydro-3-deoxy-6-phosphogalactonate aldolase [Rhodocyclaceae bacterium]MCA3141695.1 2-dehydro-3-deoxy-6-phosphogalactonate aldolase [Rhodocyclaceae bacterium]MCA3145287.1 2-dehydro-3-deoxy-6-phosphogalactonate aldolase [Rhodocyclaceae bacterium]MCE2896839.1 2-dehydro-3-deoxy-6-phosphogalactonate aldolase [Betaproteobacteria bacterium]
MSRLNHWLAQCPLVAILRGITPAEVMDVAAVLEKAGFRMVEVPMNSPDAFTSIALLSGRFGDSLLVGGGTVTETTQVARIADAGGKLVVMPHADALVVDAAKKKGMVAVPGFSTPTEAFTMIAAGADGLKLFPAEANPPRVLRSLRAVLPAEMPVLPVGSITPETMAEYWAAGASGFGLGGALYKPGDPAPAVAGRASVFMRVLGGLAARA